MLIRAIVCAKVSDKPLSSLRWPHCSKLAYYLCDEGGDFPLAECSAAASSSTFIAIISLYTQFGMMAFLFVRVSPESILAQFESNNHFLLRSPKQIIEIEAVQ